MQLIFNFSNIEITKTFPIPGWPISLIYQLIDLEEIVKIVFIAKKLFKLSNKSQ